MPYRDFPARARANLGKLDPHRTTDNCQPRYEGRWQGAHALALKRPSPVDRASRTCFAIGGLRRECLSRHSPCEIVFIGRVNCMFNRIAVVGFDLAQISSSKSRRARPPHSKCIAPHQCPLWVISGHLQRKKPCPLYPRKRTFRHSAVRARTELLEFFHRHHGSNRVGNETILVGGMVQFIELFRTGFSVAAPCNLWA